jgi:hypothetical protein
MKRVQWKATLLAATLAVSAVMTPSPSLGLNEDYEYQAFIRQSSEAHHLIRDPGYYKALDSVVAEALSRYADSKKGTLILVGRSSGGKSETYRIAVNASPALLPFGVHPMEQGYDHAKQVFVNRRVLKNGKSIRLDPRTSVWVLAVDYSRDESGTPVWFMVEKPWLEVIDVTFQ